MEANKRKKAKAKQKGRGVSLLLFPLLRVGLAQVHIWPRKKMKKREEKQVFLSLHEDDNDIGLSDRY